MERSLLGTLRTGALSRCSQRGRRILLGMLVLSLVVAIWVASSIISKRLFVNESYPKPFFSVYFKTCLFTTCLFPFLFWRPWQRLCCKECTRKKEDFDPKAEEDCATVSSERPFSPGLSCKKKSCLKGSMVNGLPPCKEEDEHCLEDGCEGSNPKTEEREDEFSIDIASVNAETGQQEVLSSTLTSSTATPSGSTEGESSHPSEAADEKVELSMSTSLEHLTITEPQFVDVPDESVNTPLLPEHMERRRSSKVRFSNIIEIRHRKSWNDIKKNATRAPKRVTPTADLSVRQTALLALGFGIMWFFANYFYQLAFLVANISMVNTLSCLSGVFVLVLSAIPIFTTTQSDKLTVTKCLVVAISVCGAVLIGIFSPTSIFSTYPALAAFYAIMGALLYALYLTLLKKKVGDTDRLEVPMFFGFVGLFDAVLMLPLLLIWNYTQLETFEWPPNSTIWTLLVINGFVGTVLSELLWLIGSFLTSPLAGTLSLALVAPISIGYDILFEHACFSVWFFIGAVLVLIAFICVAVLESYGDWDPIWKLIKYTARKLWAAADTRDSLCTLHSEINPETEALLNSTQVNH